MFLFFFHIPRAFSFKFVFHFESAMFGKYTLVYDLFMCEDLETLLIVMD